MRQLGDSEFAKRVFPRVMEAWATNDPAGANAWYFAADQAALRNSTTASAGDRFAQAVFRWRAQSNPAGAAAAIDSLSKTAEIYGAIEGLGQAAAIAGSNAGAIGLKFERLTVRKKEAIAMFALQQALSNAAAQVKGMSPEDQSLTRPSDVFLQERLRSLGIPQ